MARSSSTFAPGNHAAVVHGGATRFSEDEQQNLCARAAELIAGIAAPTARQEALAAEAARLEVHIRRVDAWIGTTTGIIDHRGTQKACAQLRLDLSRHLRDTLAAIDGRRTRTQKADDALAGGQDANDLGADLRRRYGPRKLQ
jgi:hypothetical protein